MICEVCGKKILWGIATKDAETGNLFIVCYRNKCLETRERKIYSGKWRSS